MNHVVAEKRKFDAGPFPSPSKRYNKTKKRVNMDDFCTGCRTGHEFYERREYPTLDKLLQALKEKELFQER